MCKSKNGSIAVPVLYLAIAVFACLTAFASAGEKAVRTNDGKGADAELRESDNINHMDGGKNSGPNGELNCRFNDGLHPESKGQRNEVIALRFDLTGIDRTKIESARL